MPYSNDDIDAFERYQGRQVHMPRITTTTQTTMRIVETGGDWMGLYMTEDGRQIWQGHPSDMEPLEFLDLCDRLGINPQEIERTRYMSTKDYPDTKGLPKTIEWDDVEGGEA